MPREEKDLKRLVRERMSRTGETYSTARSNLFANRDATQPAIELGDLFVLAHDLPMAIRRVHVATRQTSGPGARAMTEERERALGRTFVPSEGRTRVPSNQPNWHGETWMELDAQSWRDPFSTLRPARYREEGVGEGRRAAQLSGIAATDGSIFWWENADGLGSRSLENRSMARPVHAGWVCDSSWSSEPGSLEVEAVGEYSGRPAATVLFTPIDFELVHEAPRPRAARAFDLGNEHRLIIDLATGCTLRRINYYRGEPILEREVTDLDFPEAFDDALFAPPSGRVLPSTPGPRHYRQLSEIVEAVPFQVLVPRVPEGWRFSGGAVFEEGDGPPRVALIYIKGPGVGFTIAEAPVEAEERPTHIDWIPVERDGRVVEISSVDPTSCVRNVRTVVGGIRAEIQPCPLQREEAVELALSLTPAES
ncbi:MAG TPA: hypothetical protein VNF07_12380 [Acidimicrobiales bacterium]|nr:hypothetical protein [Acidimicrobiales bacterium]